MVDVDAIVTDTQRVQAVPTARGSRATGLPRTLVEFGQQ
jgi:hypothetical protein